MKKINDRLLSWASMLEDNTEQQARTTARMPFVFPHLALMPDAHLGLGATVGSVIPTLGAIMPAAVYWFGGVLLASGSTAMYGAAPRRTSASRATRKNAALAATAPR